MVTTYTKCLIEDFHQLGFAGSFSNGKGQTVQHFAGSGPVSDDLSEFNAFRRRLAEDPCR
jgi:hypothetical protein